MRSALGLATTLVLTLTNASISAVRRWVPSEVRIPIYVMIIAAVVSIVQMRSTPMPSACISRSASFIPLIVTNCIVVGRAEAVAAKKPVGLSALDGMAIGLGATGVMVTLGSMRELLGNGTLFDGADQLLGGWAKSLRIEVVHFDSPFLLAMLPPGAFIGRAAAGGQISDRRKMKRAKPAPWRWNRCWNKDVLRRPDEQAEATGNSDPAARQQSAPDHRAGVYHAV
ncbi:electron transport complex subunit RsxE [Serratia marcescens]|uniref:Electron transport complex subunit RsxE n=1 Tax=Serratia marcescens TaxID=615 RepID=A0A939NPN0_SERMA|nr:electron transport complex subunit RsxE [Serratia marcescens]